MLSAQRTARAVQRAQAVSTRRQLSSLVAKPLLAGARYAALPKRYRSFLIFYIFVECYRFLLKLNTFAILIQSYQIIAK
jgi:hypothetical protein